MSETASTPPLSDEEKQLAKQLALAEYKNKIAKADFEAAEAKKKLLALNNPLTEKDIATSRESLATSNLKAIQADRDVWKGPEVKALEGKITAEGTFIESRILANKTLIAAFEDLVNTIKSHKSFTPEKLTFVIYNASDLPLMELYASMLDQLEAMKGCYKNTIASVDIMLSGALNQSALAGGAVDPLLMGYAAGGIIRTVADILSFFKTNTTFNNFDLTIDDTAMVACFIQAISKNELSWTVFHPSVYPINTIKTTSSKANKFVTLLNELRNLNNSAVSKLKIVEQKLAALLEASTLETDEKKKESTLKEIKSVEAVKEDIDRLLPPSSLVTHVSNFFASFSLPSKSSRPGYF